MSFDIHTVVQTTLSAMPVVTSVFIRSLPIDQAIHIYHFPVNTSNLIYL